MVIVNEDLFPDRRHGALGIGRLLEVLADRLQLYE
jgi:hypothetical protein